MKAKEINFHYVVNRSTQSARWGKSLLVVAFTILTTMLFGYIPYITSQQDVVALENVYNNLATQLNVVQSEQSQNESFSVQEILYNDAYSFLLTQKVSLQVYLQTIMDSAEGYITISSYSINGDDKIINIIISNPTEANFNEFILQIYEDFGVDGSDDSSRWIEGIPTRSNLSGSRIEVTFHYA